MIQRYRYLCVILHLTSAMIASELYCDHVIRFGDLNAVCIGPPHFSVVSTLVCVNTQNMQ